MEGSSKNIGIKSLASLPNPATTINPSGAGSSPSSSNIINPNHSGSNSNSGSGSSTKGATPTSTSASTTSTALPTISRAEAKKAKAISDAIDKALKADRERMQKERSAKLLILDTKMQPRGIFKAHSHTLTQKNNMAVVGEHKEKVAWPRVVFN